MASLPRVAEVQAAATAYRWPRVTVPSPTPVCAVVLTPWDAAIGGVARAGTGARPGPAVAGLTTTTNAVSDGRPLSTASVHATVRSPSARARNRTVRTVPSQSVGSTASLSSSPPLPTPAVTK